MVRTVSMKGRKLKIVRSRTSKAFCQVYLDHLETVEKNAWRQRVPGMDRDDVVAEMSYCLWLAFKKFDRRYKPDDEKCMAAFGVFWWSIWLNRRIDHIRRYNAEKRAADELPFSPDELVAMSPVVYPGQLICPPSEANITDTQSHIAWSLLALGYLPQEVRATLHISNRRYYELIGSWRTKEVYEWLTNQYR